LFKALDRTSSEELVDRINKLKSVINKNSLLINMNLIDYAEHCKLNKLPSNVNIATKVINTTTNKLDDNTVIGKIEIADKNDNTDENNRHENYLFKKSTIQFQFHFNKKFEFIDKGKKTPLYLNF
jgi:hypothetical protein